MAKRKSQAVWEGDLKSGKGVVRVGSGLFEGSYSFPSRFEQGEGTNPEELIGAAHAGCFSMALSGELSEAGFQPRSIQTEATVVLEKEGEGFAITRIELATKAEVPDIDEQAFQQYAEAAKSGCPVSKALAGTKIELRAELLSG